MRSNVIHFVVLSFCCLGVLPANAASPHPKADNGISIGVNKYDLFAQYNGTASGGDGGPAYRKVTRAMAKKAIADAADIGIRYMRVSMSGRTSAVTGQDSLDLWRTDPAAFWQDVDQMMDDLDAHGIQIVPVLVWGSGKFPLMAGEPLGEMFRNPKTRSWKLLESFVTEFVTRYRGRNTVLFYELTNELNNYADLDMVRRCKRKSGSCSEGDRFTVDDMIAYTSRLTALIHRLDKSRLVSSGFTTPRPSAEHLRASPEWTTQKTDWRKDTREQFAKNLEEIHAGTDIISIHLYGGKNNWRFGSNDPLDLLVIAKKVADKAGKPLFVGEFGDPQRDASGDRSHALRMMDKIAELKIPYSALWVWELYHKNTYTTHNDKHTAHSLEPGYTDRTIRYLRSINLSTEHGARLKASDITPPRVVLTWPMECAVLRKYEGVHAVASDDAGAILKVEFLLDGHALAEDDAAPFQTNYIGHGTKPGKHRLTARAYDTSGNISEYSTTVMTERKTTCEASQE